MPSPSKSQLQAITHGTGPMLVLAGPGSGKTFVMIQRIQYLLSHYHVAPSSILVISFSRLSAVQLKERFFKLNPIQADQIHFSTFHACFFHILKNSCSYTVSDIVSPKEQDNFINILLNDPVFEEDNSAQLREEYLHKFSYYKNKGLDAMRREETELFQRLFHAYQELMYSHHKLDFDDMGLLCLKLFRQKPEILMQWQKRFTYILIDEFQDINPIQFSIVQLLAERTQNLFVVGDDDQAIYSFRGSSPGIMLNFETIYPQAKRVLLETNFRCSGNIVQKSLAVIEENQQRFRKEILSSNPPKEAVGIHSFENPLQEYTYVCRSIEELMKRGVKTEEIACIFRTNQNMSGLAETLVRHRLPFSMKAQKGSIYRHFIAGDLLAYLSFFIEGRKRKDFFRIMNKPLRYLSRGCCREKTVSWDQLLSYYRTKPYMYRYIAEFEIHERRIRQLDLYGAVIYIRRVIGYEAYAQEEAARKGTDVQEVREILDFVQESFRGITSLEQYRNNIEEYEKALAASAAEQTGVQLITMHACKGLEYDYVFLPDCNEGKVPHKRAKTQEEVEEERRMFYVAMTRAKEKLEILYLYDKEGKKYVPSPFLPLKEKE